jgi:acyl dehydratase
MTADTTPVRATVEDLAGLAGRPLGQTAWREVDQATVNAFADLTADHNPVHVDPGFAAETPFGGTIAHGFLTLSLLAPLVNELLIVEGASLSINYGLDKVRFPAPVPVGGRIRATAVLSDATEVTGGVQIRVTATVEIEGADKPGVVAECVFRHYA